MDQFGSQTRIVAVEYGDARSVPAFFARDLFAEFGGLSGHEGARQIIRKHSDETVTAPFARAAIDIDTRDDYLALCVPE